MYAGTIFTIEDRSDIPSLITAETIDMPIEMIGFTSNKGTEDYVYVDGDAFFDQFGYDISYARHGQPLLQAANAINNGARLFCKRVVAQDSTLANNGIVAYVSTETTQKTDADGNLLYIDANNGQETTYAGDAGSPNQPATVSKCKITYNTVSIDATESNDINTVAKKFVDSVEDGYPLFLVADVGRGVSNKRIRINPDYNISRTAEYVKYIVYVDENNETIDQFQATLNPDTVEVDQNINIQTSANNRTNKQVRIKLFEEKVYEFFAKIKETLQSDPINMSAEDVEALDLKNQDLLFGKNFRGDDLATDYLTVDTQTQLNGLYGIPLLNGSNGSFGDYPINAAEYNTEMAKVFNGQFSDCIYNVDNNPMDVIIDANYANKVKRAIEDLVEFREDVSYLRDLGNEDEHTGERTPCTTILEMQYANQDNAKNRYCSTYCTWYDIIDPYTYKQITVTIGYSLARLIVSHFVNGRNRPLCGIKYNVTIPEAIAGTVNFIPKITPAGNQKAIMEDLKINYACYLDGTFTIETCYTSQEKFTQLSYSNNVFNIQQIIHEVRKKCPKIRYTFMDQDDFDSYQKEINSLLSQYSTNFMSLEMEYVADSVYASNKIYYAIIYVKFRNFVQTEMFKIVALQS